MDIVSYNNSFVGAPTSTRHNQPRFDTQGQDLFNSSIGSDGVPLQIEEIGSDSDSARI